VHLVGFIIRKVENSKVEPSKKGYATENVTGACVGGKSFFQEQSYLRVRH
jgi:hypothetical protein